MTAAKSKTVFFHHTDNEVVVFGDSQMTGQMKMPDSIAEDTYREFLKGRLRNRILFDQGDEGVSLVESDVAPGTHVLAHKHNTGQLILIVEGSMRQGSHVLNPGDGYFTPAGTAYGFVAGPEGCRYVEFREGSVRTVTTDVTERNPARLVHEP
ncbi:cupin domain-containing protein [Cryptosporangium sp. NPDC051539]|uniref:cupin domain-containing protein n=1 Tax=Cryptosporangium sp. NPDC051539 TaxID=3363962 RepID=UPI0037AB150D